ncbi:hypothetical protein [Streptomyces sp. NPDC053069]|uniref:hypothetical protein n=1 Tax=Streptomyces sp. NPDC053069 TaxID=3365695 RepID=UPI0037D88C17
MKKKMAKALIAAAAVPALLVATSGSASADDWVMWQNAKSHLFLTHGWGDYQGQVKGGMGGTGWEPQWWDIQNSDGSWNETAGTNETPGPGRCMTGYWRQVYTEPCNPYRDQTNNWQRWREIPTNTGWKLQNVQTGWILDDEGHGGIYANDHDYGNANQRWK